MEIAKATIHTTIRERQWQQRKSRRSEKRITTTQETAAAIEQERAVVNAAQHGDNQAFAELVRQHQHIIYGYLRARLIEPADAEDLCQEVFLRSYQDRQKFARADSIRPWLIGIARNVLREHVRRITRRREVEWTELCLELDQLTESQSESQTEETLVHLDTCLDSLGKSARQALDMRYQSQLKLAQIGSKIGRSEGAVKLLMYRARLALKNCLDRKLGRTD